MSQHRKGGLQGSCPKVQTSKKNSSSKSTVSKVESVSAYFKKKNAQAESPTETNKSSTIATEDNLVQEPDSPYKNLIKTEIKVNLDDSTEDAADFKSPVLIRKPNNLQLNKASQIGRQKSKAPVKKRNKQSSKINAGKNYKIKIIEDNFKLFGDNPEHMQMAMALSKSSYEAEHGCQSPSKEDMSDVGELLRSSKPTFLERFGFTSDKNKTEKRKATEGSTKTRNRFKYITPILNIRTNDERETLIESKISLILGHENLQPKKLFKQTIHSTLLNNYVSKEKSIFNLDRIYEKNNFYVPRLNIPRDTTKCGCMLKSWDSILGRDKSPCKYKADSSSDESGTDLVKSFKPNLTNSSEMFSDDKASSLLTDDAESMNSCTKNIEETVTSVTQTTTFEKLHAEEKLIHIKSPVKHLTDTLDVGACCSFTTSSRTSQINVGSFESESKDSAITTSLYSSPRLTVPSYSSSMRSISPDLFASDEEFSEQLDIETGANTYFQPISRENCKDTDKKQSFVGDIDARTAVKNVFDSKLSQAFVSYNDDKQENCSFNEVIDLTDDDESINKSLDNSRTHVNNLGNNDLIKEDHLKLNIVETNACNASLNGEENKLLGDSFKSSSNDSPLKNNRHGDLFHDQSVNLMDDNDTINFSTDIINDVRELLDERNHNVSVVEEKGNNTKENEIIDLTDDDSFKQNLNTSLLPDKQTTKNDMDDSCISSPLENKTKKKSCKRKTDIYSLKEFEIEMEFEAENEKTVRDISAIGNGTVETNREYVKLLKNKYKIDASMENYGKEDAFPTDNEETNLLNTSRTSDNISNFKEPETIKGNSSGSFKSPSKKNSTHSSFESCVYNNLSDRSPNIIEKETSAVQDPDRSTVSFESPPKRNSTHSSSEICVYDNLSDGSPDIIEKETGAVQDLDTSTVQSISDNKIRQQEDYYGNKNSILEDVPKTCEQAELQCFDDPIPYNSDNLSNNTSKGSQENMSSQCTDKNDSCHEFDNIIDVQENDYNDEYKNSSLDETPKRNQRSKSPFFDEPVLYDSARLDVTDYVLNMLDQENYCFDKTKKSIDGRYTNIGNVDFNADEEMPLSQESQSSILADEELNYSCHFATPSKCDRIEKKEFNHFEMEDAMPLSSENELPVSLDTPPCQITKNTEIVSKPTTTKSISTPDNFIIKTDNVTPMPDYDQMGTPLINNELQKYGLKPLKRNRGTKLLKYIYESTHPLVTSDQHIFDALESDEDKRVIKRRKKDDQSSSSIQAESLSVVNSAASIDVGSASLLEIVGNKIIENEKLEDLIFERKQSVRIPSCRVPLQIVWHNLVSSHPEIKENILLYEPLQLESLHLMIKEQGYKFHIQDLLTFLDKKCITIRTAQKQGKAHR